MTADDWTVTEQGHGHGSDCRIGEGQGSRGVVAICRDGDRDREAVVEEVENDLSIRAGHLGAVILDIDGCLVDRIASGILNVPGIGNSSVGFDRGKAQQGSHDEKEGEGGWKVFHEERKGERKI